MISQRTFFPITFIFIIFFIFVSLSCSDAKKGSRQDQGSNQGDGTGQDDDPGEDPNPSEEEGEGAAGAPAIFNPTLTMSPEGRKEIFSRIPDTDLTGWDKITRCEVQGDCTHEDAVKWKILHYFNHPDLDSHFKATEGETSHCGTSTYLELKYEISRSADLRNFFNAIRQDMDNRNAVPASPPSQANIPSTSRSAIRNIEAADDLVEIINTLDGSLTFAVYKDDPDKNTYRNLNRQKTVTAPGGREFDVYYVAGDESYANAVEEAVKNPALWDTLAQVFEEGINVRKLSEHPRPIIFLVNKALSGGGLGHALSDREPAEGYATITTSFTPKTVLFVRTRTPEYSKIQDIKATTVHELYHLNAQTFFNWDQFTNSYFEAHPTWLENRLYGGLGLTHERYRDILYHPDIPFDHPDPSNHKYAISLLWDFLSCRSGDPLEPVRLFNQCLADGNHEADCLSQTLSQGGKTAEQTILQFGESMMNIGLEGAIDLKTCDPDYKPEYLLSAYKYPADMFERSKKMVFEGGTERFSVRAYVFVTSFGDTVSNYFKTDVSNLCTTRGYACSLLGFKVDKGDRRQFRTLFHQRFFAGGTNGLYEYRATETDSEPDVVVLLVANTDRGAPQAGVQITPLGKVELQFKPFSSPVDFFAERSDYYGTTSRTVHFEGQLDVPDSSFPEETSDPWWYKVHFFKPEAANIPQRLLSDTFVPLKQGQMTWEIHYESTEGMCPFNVIKTVSDGSGTETMNIQAGDNVSLWNEENGLYSFDVRYHDSGFLVPLTTNQDCGPPEAPCCPDPPPGLANNLVRMDPLQVISIGVVGNFQEGTKSLLIADPTQPNVTGTITFSEPLESEWYYRGEDSFGHGGLMGDFGARNLMYQLVPPIIDFEAGMQPADAAQPDFSWE